MGQVNPRAAGEDRPMDIEWAKDGRMGELFIVQARPETVESQRSASTLDTFVLEEKGDELAIGRSVGRKIGRATRALPSLRHQPRW